MKIMQSPLWKISMPFVSGLGCILILLLLKVPPTTLSRLEFLLETIISCSATISGFVLAAVTILVSAPTSEIMKKIKQNGAQVELRWWYTEALILGAIVIIYFTVLGAIVADTNELTCLQVSLSTGILVAYIFSVFCTCRYLLKIIGNILDEPQGSDENGSEPNGNYR